MLKENSQSMFAKLAAQDCRLAYRFTFAVAAAFFLAFSLLQISNQQQTEYLIFYDFWRNFSALQSGDIQPFIFHNVHTYVVVSIVWYLDVLFSDGSLKFANTYILITTLLSVYFLLKLFNISRDEIKSHKLYSVSVTLLIFSIWLSPSNATTFTYTLVGILGSTLLLLSILAAWSNYFLVNAKNQSYWMALIFYVFIICFGFLTLETFLAVPLIFAIYALANKDRKQFILNTTITGFLTLGYLFFISKIVLSTYSTPVHSNFVVVIQNFLFVLSSHYDLLFCRLHIGIKTAAKLSQFIAILQLAAIFIFMRRKHIRSSITAPLLFLSMALIAIGIISAASAVLLRYSAAPIYDAISRYTPYSTMFSIGVCLMASAVICRVRNGITSLTMGWVIVVSNFVYIGLEASAMLLLDYNAGTNIVMTRLEMPLYAMNAESEVGLGPSDSDAGLGVRTQLHGFLKEHQFSVFASDGYRSLGKTLPPTILSHNGVCVATHENNMHQWPSGYQLLAFNGIDNSDGFFLVTDDKRTVKSFSFAARVTSFSNTVHALLPKTPIEKESLFFVRFRDGEVVDILNCS